MKKEKIFLFDMDGTLTPVRGKMETSVTAALKNLTRVGKVGIVTGSDFEYVSEQVIPGLDLLDKERIEILPCNGTKKYLSDGGKYFLESQVDMVQELGRSQFNELLRVCSQWQSEIMHKFFVLPYAGTFLQFRGSLLNWCPIGRSATAEQREVWVDFDRKNIVRVKYVELLQDYLRNSNINVTVALGGSTSIDIYPTGWDKTYALRHYEGKDVFFVGDKCQPGGNDYHIYRKLQPTGRSFETHSTDETCKIILSLIEQSNMQ